MKRMHARATVQRLLALCGALALAPAAFPATLATEAPEPREVTTHPIFREPFSCSQHWEGNLAMSGDALGSDCVIQRMVERDGRRWMRAHSGEGLQNEDWFGWGQEVLSPCDCEVLKTRENGVVNTVGVLGKPPATAVMLKRDDGVFFAVAHLQGLRVKPGERVAAGAVLGTVGNNGMSRHPHIHIGAWRGQEALQIRFDLRAMGRLLKDW